LETLSVIAYKQPITRAEIENIRGVDISGVLRSLLDKKLIKTAGKKDCIGRPTLYRTTDYFLKYFGLKDISDMPDVQELEK
jgi:segregation and condensation protein B